MAWSSLNLIPQPGTNFAGDVASDGTLLYIITRVPYSYSYDPGTTNYTALAADPPDGASGRIGALVWALKGGVPALFFLGRDGAAFLDIFISSAWSSGAPDPSTVRSQFAAGWYNNGGADGGILVAGGYDVSGNPVANAISYDIATDVWTTGLSPMPAALAEGSGVWISGKFYIFGGWDGAAYTPTGYVYDPGLDSWSSVSVPFDNNSAGQPAVIDLHDGTLLLAGGYGDNPSDVVWRYKPAVDAWASVDPVPFNAYMVGGSDSAGNAYVWSVDDVAGEGALLPFTPWSPPADAGVAIGTGAAYSPSPIGTNPTAHPETATATGEASSAYPSAPHNCHWTFLDQHTSVTYVFEVNPNEGGSPQRKKNITKRATTAPFGKTLVFEGADEPLEFEWSGTLLEATQLQAYKDWYNKRHQIKMTDDLGRVYTLYITSFEPKRVRSAHWPYKHTYTAKAILLDWPS